RRSTIRRRHTARLPPPPPRPRALLLGGHLAAPSALLRRRRARDATPGSEWALAFEQVRRALVADEQVGHAGLVETLNARADRDQGVDDLAFVVSRMRAKFTRPSCGRTPVHGKIRVMAGPFDYRGFWSTLFSPSRVL